MTELTPKSLLSPRELAEAIGVSESSIKRWADDGTVQALRTAGGHRRIPVEEAIAFIREGGLRIVRPDLIGLNEIDTEAAESLEHGSESELLYTCLREGRAEDARSLILSLYIGGWSIAQLIDGPIQNVMRRLGELWKHDVDAIFLEHRATDILIQSLSHLRSLLRIPPAGALQAIGAAPSGDPYILPTLSASLVLSDSGFQTTNLGPETPIETLEQAARQLAPSLIWVSVSAVQAAERLRSDIQRLAQTLAEQGGTLVVGGRAVRSLALTRSRSLFIGMSMAELEAFVKGFRSSPSPSTSPHRVARPDARLTKKLPLGLTAD